MCIAVCIAVHATLPSVAAPALRLGRPSLAPVRPSRGACGPALLFTARAPPLWVAQFKATLQRELAAAETDKDAFVQQMSEADYEEVRAAGLPGNCETSFDGGSPGEAVVGLAGNQI